MDQSKRKFYGNKKLYNEKTRQFFQDEDCRNPAGHEPDWTVTVAMRPVGGSETAEELERQGVVGLFERLPDDEPTVIADDDPRRLSGTALRLMMAATPAALAEAGFGAHEAFEASRRFDDLLVEAL